MSYLLIAIALGGADIPRPRPGAVFVGIVFLATLLFLTIGHITVLIAAMMLVVTATWMARTQLKERQALKRAKVMMAYLSIVCAQLRSGATPAAALAQAAENLPAHTPEPLTTHLHAVAHVAASGGDVGDFFSQAGLEQVGDMFCLGQHYGIALADLCENLVLNIEHQQSHAQATKAALQGPQSSAVVLSLLPLVGIAMGFGMGANPVTFLGGGGLGGVMLVLGVGLICAGGAWSYAIIEKAKSG